MSEIETFWLETQNLLKTRLGETVFQTWIPPLKLKEKTDSQVTIEAPDMFFRDWIEKHYKIIIHDVLKQLLNNDIALFLTTNKEAPSAAINAAPTKITTESLKERVAINVPTNNVNVNLNPRYTFENFVLGSSNRHSHAYCLSVAEAPGKNYNPLFIYGGVGLGKTHLMHAVCHHIKSKKPNLKISYLTSEKFTNELIDAIQHHSTTAFRLKYRNVDLLVIDDIQFIAGKESTQEEFFHTFNTLYDAHKQIIITSDRTPKEINNLQERLVSRFSWGLTTDIQPPDLETRVAILKKKIEREPVSVSDDVIFFIAQLVKTNIRELEGALVRVMAYSLLEEKIITLDLAKEVLKDLLKEPKKLITVDFIQRCVGEEFGITLQDFKSKKRTKNIVLPRQVAMYLSREMTDLSFPEIGTYFGGKDHTTVLHSYNKIKEENNKNQLIKDKIKRIMQVIQQ